MNASTLQLYRQTVFRTPQTQLPSQFAIITVHNPHGQLFTSSKNHERDQQFVYQLTKMGVDFYPMDGYAPSLDYSEAGWAIICEPIQARRLAIEWQQNAYYWVKEGLLYLAPACMHFDEECISTDFKSRLI